MKREHGMKRTTTTPMANKGSSPLLRCRGFTLVEIMIATLLTLIVMGALVGVFSSIGASVADSRSSLEMADRLRNARALLQADLGNVTCPTVPGIRAESGAGFFEYVEGPFRVFYTNGSRERVSPIDVFPTDPESLVHENSLEDFDDLLLMTIRTAGESFIGSVGPKLIRSNTAEVIWYCRENPADGSLGIPGLRTVFRKLRLIAPNEASSSPTVTTNSLADLTNRANRSFRAAAFPHEIDVAALHAATNPSVDTVLPNVLSFDVRVFDSEAPLYFKPPNVGPIMVGEKGWDGGVIQLDGISGGYVDLGFLGENHTAPTSLFSSKGDPKSGLSGNTTQARTFCTWDHGYESDGIDQDGDSMVDEGTDGFDTDAMNGVDDAGERETAPPYAVALRGIKVTMRVLEPDSGQIRQISVIQHFAPK
jgi:type II secretory pathway pseudopilin PulG